MISLVVSVFFFAEGQKYYQLTGDCDGDAQPQTAAEKSI